MDELKELVFVFFALSVPVLPALITIGFSAGLLVALWLGHLWAKRRGRPSGMSMLVAGMAYLLVFYGDGLFGRIVLYSLCAADGGWEIHRRVELPGSYWNEDGRLEFAQRYEDPRLAQLGILVYDRGPFRHSISKSLPVKIDWYELEISGQGHDDDIATYTRFAVGRSWFSHWANFGLGRTSCPGHYRSRLTDVFTRPVE